MNLPNALSLFRLLLAPVFVAVYFTYSGPWALGVYALASLTDVLDGHLARRLGQITKLGRILDPLADKLMSATVLVCLGVTYPLLFWAVVVFAVKEALMGVGALIQYQRIADVPPSEVYGKCAAAYFFVCCAAVMLFPQMDASLRLTLVASAIAVTLGALILYLIRYLRAVKSAMQNEKNNQDTNNE